MAEVFHELGGPLILPLALDAFLCEEAKRVESGVLLLIEASAP